MCCVNSLTNGRFGVCKLLHADASVFIICRTHNGVLYIQYKALCMKCDAEHASTAAALKLLLIFPISLLLYKVHSVNCVKFAFSQFWKKSLFIHAAHFHHAASTQSAIS